MAVGGWMRGPDVPAVSYKIEWSTEAGGLLKLHARRLRIFLPPLPDGHAVVSLLRDPPTIAIQNDCMQSMFHSFLAGNFPPGLVRLGSADAWERGLEQLASITELAIGTGDILFDFENRMFKLSDRAVVEYANINTDFWKLL